MSTIRKITGGMEARYWIHTALAPFAMIGEVVFETLIPMMMVKLIDVGIAERDFSYILKIGLVVCAMSLVSLCCGALGARCGAVGSQGFSRNLRRKLFSKVQGFSFSNVDHFSTASLVTRLTTDVTNAQNVFRQLIQFSFRAPFMLVAGTLMAFRLNTQLALVFLVAIPVLALVVAYLSVKAYPRFSLMLEKYDALNTIVQENLIGIRAVKAFVRRDYENLKFDRSADAVRKTHENAEKLVIRNLPVMQLVMYSTTIAVFWFGGRMVVFGKMTSGELISFLAYVTQILTSLMMVGMIFITFVLSRASVRRIVEVLDEEEDIKNPSEKSDSVSSDFVKDGSVDFENVYFSYIKGSKNYVLENINIHIDSGKTVGIIGGTGSSKSTLVSLIPRLYDVSEGSVKVGGLDVRDCDLVSLRDSVSMVLQKNVLFSGTIKENLRWGKKDATDSEMIEACRASDADSFIKSFPEGYDTFLRQGGVNLSGGQKQRLCIARALLKNPKILILDDSTSAVDTATEKRIQDALKNLFPETTKIIIAQRISSVKDADMIIVLDNGKIDGVGTHEELLRTNRIYQEVNASQETGGDADIA